MLAICLNPALDITYEVDLLRRGTTHRVRRVHMRAGGKAVNVARVLQGLGAPVAVAGFAAGATGQRLAEELAQAGLETRWVWVEGETRRCLAVFEQDVAQSTEFNEPGPEISPGAWEEFVRSFAEWVRRDEFAAVVLSGSLPPGLPGDAYACLIRLARSAGLRTVLDTSGEALRHGLVAAPDMIKPNLRELEELMAGELGKGEALMARTGRGAVVPGRWRRRAASSEPRVQPEGRPPLPPEPRPLNGEGTPAAPPSAPPAPCDRAADQPLPSVEEILGDAGGVGGASPRLQEVRRAAEALQRAGPAAAVISMGAGGVVAATPAGTWWAQGPVVRGNPVGAGDALVAGLVDGALRGWAWPECLAHAVAVAAATVTSPVAGRFEADAYASLRPQVRVVALSPRA
ncbi:1-phosphofructokinase family hexose kinase [Thermaerobacter subterraneus]|uniref:1-phosphofructokinase family hexose kinase n=1 Tax=Thermaerobacter subterraneus TaxID=175696 RepID=UPI0003018311|nr:PfkB family carbohydrate kinase [Thermaerobacter subterraneus]